MSKVLLINPSYASSYGGSKSTIVNPVYPTLGLATIAALPKKNGHNVKILDLSYQKYDFGKIRGVLANFKPDIVGVTATTPTFNQARDISYLVKDVSQNIVVVCGGTHVSSFPHISMLESNFDAVFVGEADYSFNDLCQGKSFQDIKGLFYRSNGSILSTGNSSSIANLDDLPFPAWDLYDLSIYAKKLSRLYVKKTPAAKIEFSRGCVYKCSFCASHKTLTRKYRKKSPERCAEELAYAKSLGFNEMLTSDDIFTTDNDWAYKVSEAISRKGINIPWSCSNGIRVESANLELFKKMKEAGCYRVFFGFESGSDQILDNFGKGGRATVDRGREAVRMAKAAQMDVGGYFMLGLPGENLSDISKTIRYANELPLDTIKFSITTPFPGSKLFDYYRGNRKIKSYDWDQYHMASEQQLFTHENLSYRDVQKTMQAIYRKTMFYNPRFYLNRFRRSLRAKELLNDFYYFLKFVTIPSIGKKVTNNYYARNRWGTVNIDESDFDLPKHL